MILSAVDTAQDSGARLYKICDELEIPQRRIQRWRKSKTGKDERHGPNTVPRNKLSEKERKEALAVLTSKKYRDQPPWQVVASLADKGTYLASEATMYRILKESKMGTVRSRTKAPRNRYRPEAIVTTGPNQCWSWDITYLKRDVTGFYHYGYVVIDVFSRKIVAAEVYDCESSEFAAELIADACLREGVARDQLTIHSDNGAPMKGAALGATLKELGVSTSFSRPRVSNDNAISEATFRTMKYRPEYPSGCFQSLDLAKTWMREFVTWYNDEHHHSAIKFVTPGQCHAGIDREILKKREELYEKKKKKEEHPERWGSRKTRN